MKILKMISELHPGWQCLCLADATLWSTRCYILSEDGEVVTDNNGISKEGLNWDVSILTLFPSEVNIFTDVWTYSLKRCCNLDHGFGVNRCVSHYSTGCDVEWSVIKGCTFLLATKLCVWGYILLCYRRN